MSIPVTGRAGSCYGFVEDGVDVALQVYIGMTFFAVELFVGACQLKPGPGIVVEYSDLPSIRGMASFAGRFGIGLSELLIVDVPVTGVTVGRKGCEDGPFGEGSDFSCRMTPIARNLCMFARESEPGIVMINAQVSPGGGLMTPLARPGKLSLMNVTMTVRAQGSIPDKACPFPIRSHIYPDVADVTGCSYVTAGQRVPRSLMLGNIIGRREESLNRVTGLAGSFILETSKLSPMNIGMAVGTMSKREGVSPPLCAMALLTRNGQVLPFERVASLPVVELVREDDAPSVHAMAVLAVSAQPIFVDIVMTGGALLEWEFRITHKGRCSIRDPRMTRSALDADVLAHKPVPGLVVRELHGGVPGLYAMAYPAIQAELAPMLVGMARLTRRTHTEECLPKVHPRTLFQTIVPDEFWTVAPVTLQANVFPHQTIPRQGMVELLPTALPADHRIVPATVIAMARDTVSISKTGVVPDIFFQTGCDLDMTGKAFPVRNLFTDVVALRTI